MNAETASPVVEVIKFRFDGERWHRLDEPAWVHEVET